MLNLPSEIKLWEPLNCLKRKATRLSTKELLPRVQLQELESIFKQDFKEEIKDR
jgi:hypothetical protein